MNDPLWSQLQKTDEEYERPSDDSDLESQSDHDDHETAIPTIPHMSRDSDRGPHTGPKGVIADHAFYQKAKSQAEREAIAQYNAKILARAPTTTTYLQDEAHRQTELVLEPAQDDDFSEDEEVLKKYREKRLEELKRMSNRNARQQHRVFGTVHEVSADEYVSAIDNEWRTVPVLVHLYDERLPFCRKLREFLEELAEKYSLAKFIQVSAVELEFDLVGSPAILAYKGGMLMANLVRFVDLVGSKFDLDSVEKTLLRYGALSADDIQVNVASDNEDSDE